MDGGVEGGSGWMGGWRGEVDGWGGGGGGGREGEVNEWGGGGGKWRNGVKGGSGWMGRCRGEVDGWSRKKKFEEKCGKERLRKKTIDRWWNGGLMVVWWIDGGMVD